MAKTDFLMTWLKPKCKLAGLDCGIRHDKIYGHIDADYMYDDYRNDPKFLDRSIWANSVDPDQTAPRGAV